MKKRYVWFEDLDGVICCPKCGHQVDIYYRESINGEESFNPDFCPVCGQALDWTDTRSYGVIEEHETN